LDENQFSSAAEEWLDYFKANVPEKVENEQLMEIEEIYTRLCSSSYKPKPSRLLCFYKTTPTSFLRLAPFKMEQLSIDPYVVVFHDAVYSSEITRLEHATESLLERAMITSVETNTHYISNVRTVSSVWLPNPRISLQDNMLVKRIRQRIKDMSGMILDSPIHSHIQLLKYGFGGHYHLHNDFMNLTTAKIFYDDCIATVLFYVLQHISYYI